MAEPQFVSTSPSASHENKLSEDNDRIEKNNSESWTPANNKYIPPSRSKSLKISGNKNLLRLMLEKEDVDATKKTSEEISTDDCTFSNCIDESSSSLNDKSGNHLPIIKDEDCEDDDTKDAEMSGESEMKEGEDSDAEMMDEEGAYHLAEVSYGEEDEEGSEKGSGENDVSMTEGYHINLQKSQDLSDSKSLDRQLSASDFIIKRKNTKEVSKINGKLRYRNFECSICGYRTNQQRALIEHIHKHTGDKIHHCLHCDKYFRYKNTLVKHLKVLHSDLAQFSCKVCHRKFSQEGDCLRHELIHTGERPFACEHCDYTSKTKGALKDHLRIHSGDKPYACDQCEYRTAYSTLLRQHRERHHLNQTFACHQCDYKSNVTRNLKKHLKVHEIGPRISCGECPYETNCKDNLKEHIRNRHTSKEMLSCTVCGTLFKLKNSLNRHMKNHTGGLVSNIP